MKRIKDLKWCVYLAAMIVLCILAIKTADLGPICKYETHVPQKGQISLIKDQTLEQEFTCEKDTLSGLDVYLIDNNASAEVSLSLELYADDAMAAAWQISADAVKSKAYNHFFLPERLEGISGTRFRLVLTSNAEDVSSCIAVGSVLPNEELDQEALYGGVLQDRVLSVRSFYKYVSKNTVFVLVILMAAAILGVSVFVGLKKMRQERRFLLFGTLMGIIFLIIIPYLKVPDEFLHFNRIFEISEGHILSDKKDGVGGRELPEMTYVKAHYPDAKYSDIWSASGAEVRYEERTWKSFPTTALYAPVSYLPQVIGVFLGKLFFHTVFGITLMGKLAAMLSSLIMVYFSIKYIPVKKRCLVLIALMPMFLQESVSLAADCLINSLSMLTVSYALYLAYNNQERLRRRDIAFIYISTILLALCKIVYLPLCAIYLIIPKEKFGNARKYGMILGGAMALAVLGNLIWLKISSGYLIEFNPNVNSSAQVSYVLHHPVAFIQAVYGTVLDNGASWFFGLFGGSLGWLNIGVSHMVLLPYILVLFLAAVTTEKDELEIRKKDKCIAGVICLVICALTIASLYVQWTPLSAPRVSGIQGRYFIPVVIVLCSMFGMKTIVSQMEEKEKYLYPLIGWVEIVAAVSVIQAML